MITYAPHLRWVFTAVLIVSAWQGCAQTEVVTEPVAADTQPPAVADTAPAPYASPEEGKSVSNAMADAKGSMDSAPPSIMAVGTNPARQLVPAKNVTDIEVQKQGENVEVRISGDGELTYQAMRLDGNRLIIDVMDVQNGTKRKSVLVGHQMVKQIRIGVHQFPNQKVRFVLDLERNVPYGIEKTDNQIIVTLSDRISPQSSLEAAVTRAPQSTGEKASGESSKKSVPAALPERAKLLDPVTALAQPRPGAPQTPEAPAPQPGERFTGKRVSLDFQDAEISSVLRLIADVSGLNMVVGEAVKAKVTLKLLNVPWDQALDLILKLNNLGQIREGNILWIDTLNNITRLRDEAAKAKDATLKAEELVTRILYLNYADAAKSVDVAKSNLSPRGEIRVDQRTNSLVVRDINDNLAKVEKIVRDLDVRTPQVQIEARIVQASKNFQRGLGINWGVFGPDNATAINFAGSKQIIGISPGVTPTTLATISKNDQGAPAVTSIPQNWLINLPASATGVSIPTSAIGIAVGKFFGTSSVLDMRISAGESLGITKLVSAPKVITLDNKPAKIEQGQQIPYQTTSLQGTQTTFIDATLTLNVTPHVIPYANTVRLEIKATKNALDTSTSTAAGPAITKKEATTEVLLKDGETTVLGGIFEETRGDRTDGLPWFNRIPFLGWLFKNEGTSVVQSELLVFVTPTILRD